MCVVDGASELLVNVIVTSLVAMVVAESFGCVTWKSLFSKSTELMKLELLIKSALVAEAA